MAGVLESFRFLMSDLLGIDDSDTPVLPPGLPASVRPVVAAAIAQLTDYQGPGYAQLYVDRLQRFTRRRDVSEALLLRIAALMAQRMRYDDPLRLAQIKLAKAAGVPDRTNDRDMPTFRLDEFFASLPARIFQIPVVGINWGQWCRVPVSFRFSGAGRWSLAQMHAVSWLRRWRLFSTRYAVERAWIERWLHMIERSLAKQPQATPAIVETATLLHGHGETYRRGLTAWHVIIDGLAKPVFDGKLVLPDLAAAIAEARRAAEGGGGEALRQAIVDIRARTAAPGIAASA